MKPLQVKPHVLPPNHKISYLWYNPPTTQTVLADKQSQVHSHPKRISTRGIVGTNN